MQNQEEELLIQQPTGAELFHEPVISTFPINPCVRVCVCVHMRAYIHIYLSKDRDPHDLESHPGLWAAGLKAGPWQTDQLKPVLSAPANAYTALIDTLTVVC